MHKQTKSTLYIQYVNVSQIQIFVIQFLGFTNPSSFQGFCESSLLSARILYITSSVWWTCGFEIAPGYYITIHIIGVKCSYLASTSGDHFQHQQVQLRRLTLAIIPCKLSNIAVHVYPALHLMQGKVLSTKFWGWKAWARPVDSKTPKVTSLKNLYAYSLALTFIKHSNRTYRFYQVYIG